ncbi:MAG: 50S ribosomal protein L4 [Deltaproteobacteria bacterium]|nr:50S ribosomal protein L4 [Deltaproteobacteria bacterium]
MLLDVIDIDNKKVDTIEIKETLFGEKVNEHLIYDAVRMQMANKRAGTASTKTKGFVSGGGTKPWKQKGTGRARSGSIRSPLWRHGGIVFGPHPRDYSYQIPKKMRREAVRSVILLKLNENKIRVINEINLEQPKTKLVMDILKRLNVTSGLIIISDCNRNLELAARNLQDSKILKTDGLNVYDLLNYDNLIITRSAVEKIQGVFGR